MSPRLNDSCAPSWRAPLRHGDAFMGCYGRSEPVQGPQQPFVHAGEGISRGRGLALTY